LSFLFEQLYRCFLVQRYRHSLLYSLKISSPNLNCRPMVFFCRWSSILYFFSLLNRLNITMLSYWPIYKVCFVSFDAILKEVSLTLVPEATIGDYVLVHVGTAISTIDEEEAKKTFELLKQLDELNELENDETNI